MNQIIKQKWVPRSKEQIIKDNEERVKKALDNVISLIQKDGLIDTITFAYIESVNNPFKKLGLYNTMIMVYNGTKDARTFKQWVDVGRSINKGAKAFQLLRPYFIEVKIKDENGNYVIDKNTGEIKKERKLINFVPFNVFKVEDTNGLPLKEDESKQKFELPPLAEVAQKIGCQIHFKDARNIGANGYYDPSTKDIVIGTANNQEFIYFHELGHAVDDHLKTLNHSTDSKLDKETVAEITALVISNLYLNKDLSGHSQRYLSYYAKSKDHIAETITKLLKRIENVLNFIFNSTSDKNEGEEVK